MEREREARQREREKEEERQREGGRSRPGVLLDAVYGGRTRGSVVHDDVLTSVAGLGGPVLRQAVVGVGVGGGRVESVVVSLVDHSAALARRSLEAPNTLEGEKIIVMEMRTKQDEKLEAI